MDMENDNKHPKCFVTKDDPPIVYQEAWGYTYTCALAALSLTKLMNFERVS